MGYPNFTPIDTGDGLSATPFNTALNKFVVESNNVTFDDIRDEGLDRRSIAASTVMTARIKNTNTDNTAYSYGAAASGADVEAVAAWVQVQHGTNPLRVGVGGGGGSAFSIDPTKQIGIVRTSLCIRQLYWNDVSGVSNVHGFQLYYQPTGGAPTAIPATYRQVSVKMNPGSGIKNHQPGSLTIAHQLYISGAIDWIELRVNCESGAFDSLAAPNRMLWLSEGSIVLTIRDR